MKKITAGTLVFFVLTTICLLSCQKDLNFKRNDITKNGLQPAVSGGNCNGIIDSMPATNYDGDSIERPTILGIQHVNPYLLANMQQAYANLGITNVSVAVNNQYVRFLPNSAAQLGLLDSTLDSQGLDLFDTPMDYDVLQEGDYYQDPAIPTESVTYQYAVVPVGFQFPAGITYSILAQIHIPDDAYTAVETEAERLASLQDCGGGAAQTAVVKPDGINCNDPACHFDYTQQKCICCAAGSTWNGTQCVPTCQAGYYWNGTACVVIPPPAQSPDAAIPAGNITVSDVNLGTTPGVRNVRIVLKRWFKIQRLVTDNNGHFVGTKHFKHKVKVQVKFKNSYADIKSVRGIRLWQMFMTLSKTTGVYSGNKSSITFNFSQYPQVGGNNYTDDKGNRFWAAATIHNTVQEHRDYASQYSFSPAPTGLRILITSWAIQAGSASTPLFGKRTDYRTVGNAFISTFIYGTHNTGAWTQAWAVLSGVHLDMFVDYHIDYGSSSYQAFSSDWIKGTVYHELSHASQYVGAGATWYNNFVNAVLNETAAYPGGSYNPYGGGTDANSPIISVGEAWGYHMGHFLANQKYNIEPGSIKGDAYVFIQAQYANSGTDGFSLENFIPTLTSDPFKWIPKGLMTDLIDNSIEPAQTGVNDQVSGYTLQQIFAALQSDVASMAQFKARLLQQNPSNPTNAQINNLFASYGY